MPILLISQNNDCATALVLCNTTAVSFNPNGAGFNDFNNPNNLPGCIVGGEHSSLWLYFEVAPSSPPNATLTFTIVPDVPTNEDYDFAVYGPNVSCGDLGSPIRCSSTDDNFAGTVQTGLSTSESDLTEGPGNSGNGFVQNLVVNPGQSFYVFIDNFNVSGNGFTMQFGGNAILDCSATPPCAFDLTAGNDVTRCQGAQTVALTSSAVGAPGTVVYHWTPATYLNNANIANPTATIPANFTGTISYIVSATYNNCTDLDTIVVTVNANPIVSITPPGPRCTNSGPVQLQGSPAGGIWSGVGVNSGGIFNPTSVGNYSVTYTVTQNGCSGSASVQIQVNAPPNPSITPAGPLCANGNLIQLLASPSGGVWAGEVTPTGIFDPTVGAGNHVITYTATTNGCSSSNSITIVVNNPPVANADDPGPLCTDDGLIILSGTPTGGTWTGTGILPNGQINTGTIGVGPHTVTYTVTTNGCSGSDQVTFTITAPPSVNITQVGPFCESANPVQLIATPGGGNWSGNVPGNGIFDPAQGPGTYQAIYTYLNASGCSGKDTISIVVNALPTVQITNPGPLCVNAAPQTLTGTPAGGVWGGSANALGQVNPATLGVGSHAVTYSYTNANGCNNSTQIMISVVNTPTVTITPAGPFCTGQAIQTLSANPAGGTWSGAANAAGQFNPVTAGTYAASYTYTNASGCSGSASVSLVVNDGPTVTINPAGPYCVDDCIHQLSATPIGGTWSGSANASGQINACTLGAGAHTAQYTVSANGCSGTATTSFTVLTLPTASISGSGSLCAGGGGSVNLTINSSGSGTLQVTYAIDMVAQSPVQVTAGVPYTLTAITPGTYTILNVSDAQGCDAAGTGSGLVTINTAPTVSNIATACNGTNTSYTVSFQISGGNPATYTVTGGGGSISTGPPYIFTSTPINSGLGYNFVVNDINNCAPATVADNVVQCNCTTAVGSMSPTPIAICGNGCANAIYNSAGQNLDLDDNVEYVLHTGSGAALGTIIARNNTPTFCFNAGTMMFGVTYYISAIAGNNNNSGGVDITDNCLAVAQGTPVVFNPVPTASLGTSGAICTGNPYNLTLTLTGTPPWNAVYSDGANNYTLNGINASPYTLSVSPAATTTYSLVSLSDNNCNGTVSGQATVTVHTAPVTTPPIVTIDGTNTTYTVSFQISGGNPATYSATGTGGNLTIGPPPQYLTTSAALACGTGFQFTVTDANNCNPVTIAQNIVVCNCATAVGAMDLTPLTICGNNCASAIYNPAGQVLDGDDALEYVLHTGSNGLGTIIARSATPDFCFSAATMTLGTTYYISAIVGNNNGSGQVDIADNCLAVAQGTPVVFYAAPTATLASGGSICPGSAFDLAITLTGNSPWNLVYSDGNTQFNAVASGSPFGINVTPAANTTYTLVGVSNAFCAGTVSGSAAVSLYGSPVISNLATTCNVTNTQYELTFTISGGDPSSYTVTGVSGAISPSQPYVFTSVLINSGTGYMATVDDANHCAPQTVSNPSVNCNCATSAGNLTAITSLFCENDFAVVTHNGNQVLDGDDLLEFVLHDGNSTTLGNIIAVSGTPSFAFDQTLMSYYTPYYITAVAGNNNGSGQVLLTDPCLSTSNGIPVQFFPLPTGMLFGDTTICTGSTTNLTFSLPATGLYDVTYSDGVNAYQLTGISNGHMEQVTPATNTTYTLISVSQNSLQSCTLMIPAGAANSAAEVNVIVSPPTYANLTHTCNATATGYVLSFEILNGDPATYTISGNYTGTISGGIFTSQEIASGAPYSLMLNDGNNCNPLTINGSFTCACLTTAGFMDQTPLSVCETATANASYNGATEVLDGNDVIEFVLHDGPGAALGNIISVSSTPSFGFVPPMVYGQTYYISAVAGNDNGNGMVSILDPCLSVAQGTPVVFRELSTLQLTGATTICQGSSADLTFTSTGVGSYQIVYSDGVGNQTLSNAPANQLVSVSPANTTTYSLVSFSDNGNPGCADFQPATVTITVHQLVNAGTANPATALCQGTSSVISLGNAITGADAGGTWSETSTTPGTAGSFNAASGTVSTAALLPGTYTYKYTVDALAPCPDDDETVSLIIHDNPIADAGDDAGLDCVDSTATLGVGASSMGVDIHYHWDAPAGILLADSTSLNPVVTQAGTYTLMVSNTLTGCSASDAVLVNVSNGAPVPDVQVNPVSCFGLSDAAIVVSSVSGGASPYLYALNGSPWAATAFFSNLSPGTYELAVQDANGCQWSTSLTLDEPVALTVDLGPDTTIRYGQSVLLNPQISIPAPLVASFIWQSNPAVDTLNSLFPLVSPLDQTSYTLTVIDQNGCSDSDNLTIFVERPRNVFVPNSISPESLYPENAFLTVYGDADVVKVHLFRVYDRWGSQLFEKLDFLPNQPQANGWNGAFRGKKLNPGVYVWYAEIEFSDGLVKVYKGDVTVR